MQIKNEAMLIFTIASDSMGSNMKDLKGVLDKHFKGAISECGSPFFVYRDGGFAPTTRYESTSWNWECGLLWGTILFNV